MRSCKARPRRAGGQRRRANPFSEAAPRLACPPGRRHASSAMPRLNAFVTPEYPVLFTLAEVEGSEGEAAAEVSLALLVKGLPSFLASHQVPRSTLDDVVVSLEAGDVRVAVVGVPVEVSSAAEPGRRLPAAFISLVCADGRRITVARVVGADQEISPEKLARHVIRQIARGVQVPDIARS